MKCRAAQRLLFAERDGSLAPSERTGLEAHLAGCSDCRQARTAFATAIQDWHEATARVTTPDAERAWQDIRREIRQTKPEKKTSVWGLPRWTFPLTAAAALAVAVVTAPRWLDEVKPTTSIARLDTARADFVDVGANSSSVVYVDDQSGWLVVWAVDDKL
jgi:predicted anti-sigma-YlaC factor YlaD